MYFVVWGEKRYALSGDGVKFDPKEVLGRSSGPTVGRMRLQGYLAHKKTPHPKDPPRTLGIGLR